jgi:diguanylate cyclase (GGDEF)-like protein/PAS domain S-box-containing protein
MKDVPKVKDGKAISSYQDIALRKGKAISTKGLDFLYVFSRLLRNENNNLENILDGTVELLPSSFQYPENAVVRITFKGLEFKTQDYESTGWKISTNLELYGEQTGTLEVSYLKPPINDKDSFTREEKLVLETIAEHLSRIAEQIQAKEDLQRSRNQLSITLDSIGDGVIVTDAIAKITRINPQAEKLTGWSEKEALGRDFHEVFHIVNSKTGESVPNPVYRVIKTGETQGLESDTILVARDGTKRHIADSAAPIRDYNDKIFSVIMVFSDVTERKDAEESLKYQLGFQKMLAEVSNAFSILPSDQLEESIQHSLRQIREFFQIEKSYVFQFSENGKQMINTYERNTEVAEPQIDRIQNISVDAFPWWIEQIKNKKNVIIPDVESLPQEAEAVKKELRSQGIRSLLSIPMLKNGIVFGFLGMAGIKEEKTWTENQIMLLTIVTELVSNAYTRKMAEEKVRYQSLHDGLTGLHNRVYMEDEMERLDTDRQLPIGLVMADSNSLKLINDAFGHEAGDEMLKLTAEILRSSCREEDIIARWGGDEFVILLPQTTEEEVKAICQRVSEKSKETHVKGVPISMALGFVIKNSTNQVMDELLIEAEEIMYKHKLEESKWVTSSVIESLLKNLRGKSFESKAHYSVMQDIAQRIGMEMGLSQQEFARLELLILLHDIGEVNISQEILNKKGPLTPDERKEIKKHPEIGYRIVHATVEYAHVAADTLSHHERLDGLGYPQGLKGKDIPLLARILAIADAYEVMSSGRPYKKAMPWVEIVAEMKRCSGFQFDSEIIEIFMRLREEDILKTLETMGAKKC